MLRSVHQVYLDSWQEHTVKWNTQPQADPTSIASLGAVSVSTWYQVDQTSLVTGGGDLQHPDRLHVGERGGLLHQEGAAGSAPLLVVTLGS